MSETSFATTRFDLQDTPPPMSLVEIRLRDLLHAIRRLARSALSIERAIEVAGLIGKETPLAIQFDTSIEAKIPEAYITYINATDGGRLFFMIPKEWTGLAPDGNFSIDTAVVLLESFHHTMLNPGAPTLHFGQRLEASTDGNMQNFQLAADDDPTVPAHMQTSKLS